MDRQKQKGVEAVERKAARAELRSHGPRLEVWLLVGSSGIIQESAAYRQSGKKPEKLANRR
ncbi:MAG: hypothetical protein ACLTSZ_05920 [Lachnospiraceae bacterium]